MKRKIKYCLGALSTVVAVAPVLSVIACSSDKQETSGGGHSLVEGQFNRGGWDLSYLKNWLTSHQKEYPDLTLESLETVNPSDIREYRSTGSIVDEKKSKVFAQASLALQTYAFEVNRNVEAVRGLNNYLKSTAFAVYGVPDTNEDFSIRTEETSGDSQYYRNDLLELNKDLNGYTTLLNSKFISGTDREIKVYSELVAPVKGKRRIDPNYITGNAFYYTIGNATSFALFRTSQDGFDRSSADNDGNLIWKETAERHKSLVPGIQLRVGNSKDLGKTFETTDWTDAKKRVSEATEDLTKVLSNTENDTLEFNVNPGTYYSHVVNGQVEKSNYELKGRDFYYGLVRFLYTLTELREKGTAEGEDIGLKGWSKEELDFLKANEDGALNNPSFYFYDLYGIDLKETVKANQDNQDDKKFIIKIKPGKITGNLISLFADNSAFQPVPYEDIQSKIKDRSKVSEQWGITNYLKDEYESTGSIKISDDYYSAAPYLYTQYSFLNKGDGIVIQKNHNYIDKHFANATDSIEKYSDIQSGKSDSAAARSRTDNFLKKIDHEYILNKYAIEQASLAEEVTKAGFKVFSKPLRSTAKNIKYYWNVYAGEDEGFNNLGRRLLWGFDTKDEINKNNDALENFSTGRGATVRALIDSSINYYSAVQAYNPGQHKEPYFGYAQEESLAFSELKENEGVPDYFAQNSDLKRIYYKNKNNEEQAYKAPGYDIAAKSLDELASEIGATSESPAQIPIFRYEFTDITTNPASENADNNILKTLNSLTDKVKFVWQRKYSGSEFREKAWYNIKDKDLAATLQAGFGPDYDGIATTIHQGLCQYNTVGLIELFQTALKNTAVNNGTKIKLVK